MIKHALHIIKITGILHQHKDKQTSLVLGIFILVSRCKVVKAEFVKAVGTPEMLNNKLG